MKGLRVNESFDADFGDGYAVCIVTDGEGTVACENKILSLNKGSSFFIGANSGQLELRGNFSLIVCEP